MITLTPITVDLNDSLHAIPALTAGARWNGWQCPYFTPEVLRANRAQLDAWGAILNADTEGTADLWRYRWDETTDLPVLTITFEDGTVEDMIEPLTLDGRTLVTIGYACFTWERTQ